MKVIMGVVLFAMSLSAQAQVNTKTGGVSNQVNPVGPVEMSNVVVPGQTGRNYDRYFILNVRNNCFGTGLRSVQNPLGPASTIEMKFDLKTSRGIITATASYPASLAKMNTTGTGAVSVTPTSIRAAAYGNVVRLEIPVTTSVTVDPNGQVVESEVPVFQNYSFNQIVPDDVNQGEYMAHSGPLSSTIHVLQPNGSYSAELQVDFPGQEGYCGGYHSPLMVFFDEARPKYTGKSLISIGAKSSYWPEKGAPGYFVAIDANKDKKINDGTELFGADDKAANGFEKLKHFDSNKDGVIDSKDKDFKKLQLFRDWNGKTELISLSGKIQSIDLKYDGKKINAIGDRAEERERSTFSFKEGGKVKSGQIIDLWFSPIEH